MRGKKNPLNQMCICTCRKLSVQPKHMRPDFIELRPTGCWSLGHCHRGQHEFGHIADATGRGVFSDKWCS